MTRREATLSGLLIIAASILIGEAITPAAADHSSGPFQLVHGNNTSAQTGVFRVDTSTGEITYCFVNDTANGPHLSCAPAAH